MKNAHSNHKLMSLANIKMGTWTDHEIYYINHWKSRCYKWTTKEIH